MRLDDIHDFEQVDADLYTLTVYDDSGEQHILTMNTTLACELHDKLVAQMGSYIFERNAAKAEFDSGVARYPEEQAALDRAKGKHDPYEDDDGPWPGESVMSFYQRTGQEGPLREVADAMNKARKES
jgi:hypothetical protein